MTAMLVLTPVLVAASPSAGSEWRGQAAFCHGPGAPGGEAQERADAVGP